MVGYGCPCHFNIIANKHDKLVIAWIKPIIIPTWPEYPKQANNIITIWNNNTFRNDSLIQLLSIPEIHCKIAITPNINGVQLSINISGSKVKTLLQSEFKLLWKATLLSSQDEAVISDDDPPLFVDTDGVFELPPKPGKPLRSIPAIPPKLLDDDALVAIAVEIPDIGLHISFPSPSL